MKEKYFYSDGQGDYLPPHLMGGRPPGRHPRRGVHGPFPPFPPREFSHFYGPLPFTIDDFKDIKLYIVFILLEHNPKGITGYEIQEKYKFPRGSLMRLLDHLESNGHVKVEESVDKGRNKKLYIMTDKGRNYFNNLKQRWAHQFSVMSDFAPPERFNNPLIHPRSQKHIFQILENYEGKEDILDYFRGMRSRLKGRLMHLMSRVEDTEKIKLELDSLIMKIEEMDSPSVDEIKNLLNEIQEKF
jgi:DNA-binding PadR family transcriptional regulator